MENKKLENEVMESTKQQLLREPNIQTTGEVIAKALREANAAYIKYVNELARHDIQLEWRVKIYLVFHSMMRLSK